MAGGVSMAEQPDAGRVQLLADPLHPRRRRLLLARPGKANALDADMVGAMVDALEAVAADPPALLVVEGSGRNFCAGFDFTGFEAASEGDLLWRFVAIEQMLARVRSLPCPTVAVVRGGAFGAGADLVAACTFRLAVPGARMRFPGFRFGLALGTRALAALVGQQAAREILLSGEVLDTDRACALGLFTAQLAESGLDAALEAIEARYTTLEPSAVAIALRNTQPSTADADLADLVRSVARPGLHARIAAYRSAG
jgi:enoyl-CoA hydratase